MSPPQAWFELARVALGTTQEGLGAMLGVSRRTAQRWANSGVPATSLPDLARVVHPRAPDLAREIATHMGVTLEGLGIAPPPAPADLAPQLPAPLPLPPPPRPLPDGVVDAVVCAAAEAMSLMPAQVRPGLYAAFARAKEIGLEVDVVERVLRGVLHPPPVAEKAPPPANKRAGRR